jgi:DNA-binding MarR family transcriptional regulator
MSARNSVDATLLGTANGSTAMGVGDDVGAVRAQGWRTLATLHGQIEAALEQGLGEHAQLSVVEYTVLEALRNQDGGRLRMQQLAQAAALSPSATTRLVSRLGERGLLTRILCSADRRGICIELTAVGRALLENAAPIHDAALGRALDEARESAELAPLVDALHRAAARARPVGKLQVDLPR